MPVELEMYRRLRIGVYLLVATVIPIGFLANHVLFPALPPVRFSSLNQTVLSQHLLRSNVPIKFEFDTGLTQSSPHYHRDDGTSIVCHTVVCGRLGNDLFEYASVLGIARATNKIPFITNPERFQGVLRTPPTRPDDYDKLMARCKKAKKANDYKGGIFQRDLTSLKPGVDYEVKRCLQSWMYFDRMRDEVREIMTFTDEIVNNATQVINRLRRLFPGRTLVGVHVRREDFLNKRLVKSGVVVGSPKYFNRAMTLFRERFPHVTFVVVGQDPQWCKQNLQPVNNDRVILDPSSAEVDMQLLSMTDHLITSPGTFSWWAAFKMARTAVVMYQKEFARKGSIHAFWYSHNAVDHVMPHWIAVTVSEDIVQSNSSGTDVAPQQKRRNSTG
ncbi:galactoside alpha-(1,2)-fucosyltransferase 2-like [Littorina saxatilis]|uniref:L-Fucosyltransferase n=1 Tax=Littorina saxatilis TaxID=31220 RepID=A0AAN9AT25_9CAEN